MVKILIADKMGDGAISKIRQAGEVIISTPATLDSEILQAEVLVVRSATKVTKELIRNANSLKLVIRAGVGLDNVDSNACKEKGIIVKNTPGASTNAVAELAIAMILGISRKVGFLHSKLTQGEWAKKEGAGSEISGKTLAIIGMGRIGQSVAQKASALGMNIIYTDREQKPLSYKFYPNLVDLLQNADYISIHASAEKGAPALLSKKEFDSCKKGAYIINLARGSLIEESALIDVLKSGQISGAALDVYPTEPYVGELEILENVLLTPHVGASTNEAQLKIADEIVEHIKAI